MFFGTDTNRGCEDIDLGGEALKAYIEAKQSVERAERSAANETQMKAIRDIKSDLNEGIARIYGPHNMSRCVKQVQEAHAVDPRSITTLYFKLARDIAQSQRDASSDKRLEAKLLRDYALINVALADQRKDHDPQGSYVMLYGATAQRDSIGAYEALKQSAQLEPLSEDLKQLQLIADVVARQLKLIPDAAPIWPMSAPRLHAKG